MEKQDYLVQRKVIAWEQVSVEATSFDEAIELAEDSEDWDEVYGQSMATDDYWVKNEDTGVARIRDGMLNEWQDGN
jgi:hypothetical protein